MLSELPGELITQGGAVGLLGLAFLMVMTGMLVPRPFYRQAVKERDEWKSIAMRSMDHAEVLETGAEIAAEVTRALGSNVLPNVGGSGQGNGTRSGGDS